MRGVKRAGGETKEVAEEKERTFADRRLAVFTEPFGKSTSAWIKVTTVPAFPVTCSRHHPLHNNY